jgi:hypothetical protein
MTRFYCPFFRGKPKCQRCDLKESAKLCDKLYIRLTERGDHMGRPDHKGRTTPLSVPPRLFSALDEDFCEIRSRIQEELEVTRLTRIPADKVEFLEKDDLFGIDVKNAASDEINMEIKAAGNCIAMDLNTAAIFHLMRIVEHGARALATIMGVTMSKRQISMATWGRLVKAMRARIRKAQRRKNPVPLDPGDLQFFQGLIHNIGFFKDLWRNEVMHTKGNYDIAEARKAQFHVKAFMELLPPRVPLK